MKKAKGILILLLVLIVLGGGFFGVTKYREQIATFINPPKISDVADDIKNKPEPEIDIDYIKSKLDNVSELRTAKITYGCMAKYKEGSVPLITKKAFSMYYEATAYAGIDVSKIECSQNEDGKYIIQLPSATLYEPYIDSDSIDIIDTDKAVLNWGSKNDLAQALQMAKSDVYTQVTSDQLLDMADKNAISVIKNLLLVFLQEDQFEVVAGERAKAVKVNPPVSSGDEYDENYAEMVKLFEKQGFNNVTVKAVKHSKYNPLIKEGKIESITIDGKESFKKSSVFTADSEVIITYQTKK
ncbi:MAG: DUF4230 domain-containing protein [Clostridia bacterium]|nr:DUF4230 domain-containing protein [Clostridia bacterium]